VQVSKVPYDSDDSALTPDHSSSAEDLRSDFSDHSAHDDNLSNETLVFWDPSSDILQIKDYVFWGARHDAHCEEACRVGVYSVFLGRMTSKITKRGKMAGKVRVIYQHCSLEGIDRVWEDGVDSEKKTLMRDDVAFENIIGRVVWAYRPDGKHVMDEQVWKEVSERLPLYFE
jgi:hypothetical protein